MCVGKHRISWSFSPRPAIAILADRLAVMGCEDDVRAAQAFAKSDCTALAEALVADLGDFVDQIDVEVDREARAEGEPRAHPGGVGVHRHVEVFAEFGKFLDKAD